MTTEESNWGVLDKEWLYCKHCNARHQWIEQARLCCQLSHADKTQRARLLRLVRQGHRKVETVVLYELFVDRDLTGAGSMGLPTNFHLAFGHSPPNNEAGECWIVKSAWGLRAL